MELRGYEQMEKKRMKAGRFWNRSIFFVVFILSSQHVNSQMQKESDSSEPGSWELFKYDMGSVFGGIGYSYSRPIHWKSEEWTTFGAVVGGTALLYVFDEQVSEFAMRQRGGVPDFIDYYGDRVGSPTYNYMLTGGVYLTGLLTKDEKLRRLGVLLLASASSAGLLQQVSKSIIGRARPEYGNGKDTFDPFNPNRSFHSFPSGHTILAFSNAYAIAKQFENPWVKTGIYLVGMVPGASRLWDGQHWLSDIAFGVAISIFTVESIDRYLDKRYRKKYNDKTKMVNWNASLGLGQIIIRGNF
tara:strand:- start:9564 stop:10463 length:900 start_codon:yes stop_codon:yes gene_type:complete